MVWQKNQQSELFLDQMKEAWQKYRTHQEIYQRMMLDRIQSGNNPFTVLPARTMNSQPKNWPCGHPADPWAVWQEGDFILHALGGNMEKKMHLLSRQFGRFL